VSFAHTDLEALAPGLVQRIATVEGVQAVTLDGSRARCDHLPDSDFDIGIYYRGEFDRVALAEVANGYSDSRVELTPVGG
jgi:predicted nucleotidyltransferase